MKRFIKHFFLIGIIFSLSIFIFFQFSPLYVVPILMYHHIDKGEGSLFVKADNFAKQMDFLQRYGYKVIALDELIRKMKDKTPLHRKSVVITFDDGWEDNYTRAFSVLKKYNFPATIFLVSNDVDKEGYLTWSQVREMQRAGISFGGHTRSHKYLPDLNRQELIEEIQGCKKDIERNLNERIDYFAYPIGGFNEEIKRIVKEAGFFGACTTNRGRDRFNRDIFALKRIKVTNKDVHPLIIFFKLCGYYNLFRHPRSPS